MHLGRSKSLCKPVTQGHSWQSRKTSEETWRGTQTGNSTRLREVPSTKTCDCGHSCAGAVTARGTRRPAQPQVNRQARFQRVSVSLRGAVQSVPNTAAYFDIEQSPSKDLLLDKNSSRVEATQGVLGSREGTAPAPLLAGGEEPPLQKPATKSSSLEEPGEEHQGPANLLQQGGGGGR